LGYVFIGGGCTGGRYSVRGSSWVCPAPVVDIDVVHGLREYAWCVVARSGVCVRCGARDAAQSVSAWHRTLVGPLCRPRRALVSIVARALESGVPLGVYRRRARCPCKKVPSPGALGAGANRGKPGCPVGCRRGGVSRRRVGAVSYLRT